MPLEIGSVFKNFNPRIAKNSTLCGIFENPLCVGLLITIIICLVIFISFRESPTFRTSLYIFLLVTGILFVHDSILTFNLKEASATGGHEQFMQELKIGGELQSAGDAVNPRAHVPSTQYPQAYPSQPMYLGAGVPPQPPSMQSLPYINNLATNGLTAKIGQSNNNLNFQD